MTSASKASTTVGVAPSGANATPAMIYSLYLENLLKTFSASVHLPLRDVLDKATGADPKTSSLTNMPRFLK